MGFSSDLHESIPKALLDDLRAMSEAKVVFFKIFFLMTLLIFFKFKLKSFLLKSNSILTLSHILISLQYNYKLVFNLFVILFK